MSGAAGYAMVLYLSARANTAMSKEACALRESASAIVCSAERSLALFGPKVSLISDIYDLASESQNDLELTVPREAIERAVLFIRTLPDDLPLPEIAIEPGGSISFDWISSRTRVFSLSLGSTNRLAFAWIDGTDRGHAVAGFDGAIPPRIIEGIREITNGQTPAVRLA
ncbi:MAG TPA: hypothetical protein VMT00_09945 [Thermoanaerobaculia bacterium]|nr:hypothetical protein [Thermoanaerobaculia bacterium]